MYLKQNCDFKVCCEDSPGFRSVEEKIQDIDNNANISDRWNGESSFESLS